MGKRKGEGGGDEAEWDLHPRAWELKQRRDSRIRGNPLSNEENPSLTGKSTRTEGKHLRLLEEGEAADLWQTGQSEKYTDCPYFCPTCPRLRCVFIGVQGGWELVCGDWRTGPERELLLAVGRRTEGTRGRKCAAGNAYGGTRDCHGSRALLLSHTQGEEPLL